jgi:hypothetical protein
MTLPPYAVKFRGHDACPCQVVWLPVFEAEAQRRGILHGPLPISQLIGGAATSAGTHSTGGAADFYPLGSITVDGDGGLVWLARQMGADATWHRWFNWDGHGGVEHVHSVLTGCIHNSAARYQIDKVRAGLNGLANDFKDDGPRPLSGRTWQQGIEWAKQQEDEVTPEDIDTIVARTTEAVVKALLDTEHVDKDGKVSVRQAINQTRNDAAKAAGK